MPVTYLFQRRYSCLDPLVFFSKVSTLESKCEMSLTARGKYLEYDKNHEMLIHSLLPLTAFVRVLCIERFSTALICHLGYHKTPAVDKYDIAHASHVVYTC